MEHLASTIANANYDVCAWIFCHLIFLFVLLRWYWRFKRKWLKGMIVLPLQLWYWFKVIHWKYISIKYINKKIITPKKLCPMHRIINSIIYGMHWFLSDESVTQKFNFVNEKSFIRNQFVSNYDDFNHSFLIVRAMVEASSDTKILQKCGASIYSIFVLVFATEAAKMPFSFGMSLNKCKRLIVGKCGKSRYFNTTFYTESILIYLPSYFTQPLQAGKKFLLLKLFPDFFPISSHCFAYQKLKKNRGDFFLCALLSTHLFDTWNEFPRQMCYTVYNTFCM